MCPVLRGVEIAPRACEGGERLGVVAEPGGGDFPPGQFDAVDSRGASSTTSATCGGRSGSPADVKPGGPGLGQTTRTRAGLQAQATSTAPSSAKAEVPSPSSTPWTQMTPSSCASPRGRLARRVFARRRLDVGELERLGSAARPATRPKTGPGVPIGGVEIVQAAMGVGACRTPRQPAPPLCPNRKVIAPPRTTRCTSP